MNGEAVSQISLDSLLAVITAYGATVTKVVDVVRKLEGEDAKKSLKWVWNVLPLGIGVAVAFAFDVNIMTTGVLSGSLGNLLTGLAIGAAGSGWHEVFDAFSGVAKAGHAQKVTPPMGTAADVTASGADGSQQMKP